MEEKQKDQEETIVSPDGALSFLFGIFSLLIWFLCSFSGHSAATLLSVGILMLILSTGALAASMVNMVRGSSKGNVNLMATILLGFFPGINTMVMLMAKAFGHVYDARVYGIMYLIGAVFLYGVCWKRRHYPAYIFLRTLFLALGLMLLGSGDLFGIPVLLQTGGWCLFIFALFSFYYGLSKMYPYYGASLPQGKPLFPVKEAR